MNQDKNNIQINDELGNISKPLLCVRLFKSKQMERNFKILTYANQYMDANRLHEGLYACSTPFLYSKETTIEKLLKQAEDIRDKMGVWHINDKYFETLKQCTLLDFKLVAQADA